MGVHLYRIDDRLIHGQVVVGWGQPLNIRLLVLVDDLVAASDWEQELYRMAVSPEIEVRFLTVAQAANQMGDLQSNGRRGLVLTGDLETMVALRGASPDALHDINLGGIHYRAGRRERLPFLYLTDQELRSLQELE